MAKVGYIGHGVSGAMLALLEARKAAAAPGDWLDDFGHENGNYWCECSTCGKRFTGHKRRVTCRVCAS